MNRIDYEYTDAKGRKHKMSITAESQAVSEIIWETIAQLFNSMKRNGTLTHFAGFTDASNRGES